VFNIDCIQAANLGELEGNLELRINAAWDDKILKLIS
jgi:hypothetical protein